MTTTKTTTSKTATSKTGRAGTAAGPGSTKPADSSAPDVTNEQSAGPVRFAQLPPGELITTGNVRADLRLDQPFLDSITAQGVLVPIVATPTPDGRLAIAYGHRRAAAAVAVGLASVPVMVCQAPEEADLVMARLSENVNRAPLSGAEQAAAHDQLALLGVSVADVARITGTRRDRVTKLRALAGHHTALAALEQLEIDGALLIAEFEDDPELVARLTAAGVRGGHDEMARVAQAHRDEAALAEAITQVEADWAAKGYQVVRDSSYADPRYTRLYDLRTPDGKHLTDQAHKTCPGRAVRVWGWRIDRINVEHLCADPAAGGHTPAPGAARTATSDAQRAKERAAVIEANKKWRAAQKVRRDHIRDWLAGAKPTPAITSWMLGQLLAGLENYPAKLTTALAELDWAADVLPRTGSSEVATVTVAANPTANRATIAMLALILADRETTAGVDSWRTPTTRTGQYLTFLATHTGYNLGDIERRAIPTQHDPTDRRK